MPPASKDTTLNAAAHAKGKPFCLTDFFSTLLEITSTARTERKTQRFWSEISRTVLY